MLSRIISRINLKNCAVILLGSAILAFGLYNVHSISGITEGGILGLTLLLDHWFGISPSITSLVLNGVCYLLGFKLLGLDFIIYSIISGGSFSAFYAIFEKFEPLWPELAHMPLTATIVGALFVGIGAGLCVCSNAAPTGDDSLALGLSQLFGIGIQWIYLISDLIVLLASLSYIPLGKIAYSLLTVIISGQIIGFMQKAVKKKAA